MNKTEGRDKCVEKCTNEFIRRTARERSGGIESLRVCREACSREDN